MEGICEKCKKQENCKKVIGIRFGYCSTDFEPIDRKPISEAVKLTALEAEKIVACIQYQVFRFDDILNELSKIDRPLTDDEQDEMYKTERAQAFYKRLAAKISKMETV